MEISQRDLNRFWKRVDKKSPEECWMWMGSLEARYGHISIHGRVWAAHRFSMCLVERRWLTDKEKVLHNCDVEGCVNPNHLKIGTQRDNVQDMIKKGRAKFPRGESHGLSVLTISIVSEARKRYNLGESIQKLSDEKEVAFSVMSDALRGCTWKCVIEPPPCEIRPPNKDKMVPSLSCQLIRRLYATGEYAYWELAKTFNVCESVIKNVVKRQGAYVNT